MCGRFTLTVDPAELRGAFGDFIFPSQFGPRYNIAPSQPVLAIPNDATPPAPSASLRECDISLRCEAMQRADVAGGTRENTADFFLWGLIPSWAKDPTIANKLINARGETIAEKPSFRGSFKHKRCLILADGFYEWKSTEGAKTKTPYFIHMKDRKPFAFAGIWDEWHSPDGGTLRTCAIITTSPNELMSTLHNRMPVILDRADYAQWLDAAPQTPDSLIPLIKPFPADRMSAYAVSTMVNAPGNDRPECIVPV